MIWNSPSVRIQTSYLQECCYLRTENIGNSKTLHFIVNGEPVLDLLVNIGGAKITSLSGFGILSSSD